MMTPNTIKKYKLVIYPIGILLFVSLVFINVIQPFSLESKMGEQYVNHQWYDTTFNLDQFQYCSFLIYTIVLVGIWHILHDKQELLVSILLPISMLFFVTSSTYNNYESLLLAPILFVFWALKKLPQKSSFIISVFLLISWAYFTSLFVLGVIAIAIWLTENKVITRKIRIRLFAINIVIVLILLLLFSNKEGYFPSLAFANHLELLAKYDISAAILLISFAFSIYLFFTRHSLGVLNLFALALSLTGLILEGFHFLIALSIVLLLESGYETNQSKGPLHLFLYLGCIATFSSTATNFPRIENAYSVGLSDEQELIKRVLNPLKINGNVLCSELDKTEARFYFGNESNYSFLPKEDLIAGQWDWLNYRMDHSINVVYFNLDNKLYEELVCLGEILGDSEWALIYHTPKSKAILIRRELKFKSIISKFEIDKSLLQNN